MRRPIVILLLSVLGLLASGGDGQSAAATVGGGGATGAQVREIRSVATRITTAFVNRDARAFCELSSPRVKKALQETVRALTGVTGPCSKVAKLVLASGRSDFLTACEVNVARVTIRGNEAILDAPHGRGARLVRVRGRWRVDLDSNPHHNNEIRDVAAYRRCLGPA